MENQVFFSEMQRFKKWWVWLILLSMIGLYSYGVIRQVFAGQPFGQKPMSDSILLLTLGLILFMSILIYNIRLDTEIRKDGVHVRFFPFHLRYRFYTWDSIRHCQVRKYNAIIEYGGWGFRLGLLGKGKSLSISGDHGLQLEFNDDKKLLIGTKKPKEMEEAILRARQRKDPE